MLACQVLTRRAPALHPPAACPQPFRLLHTAPRTLALGAGMALPLAFTSLGDELYAAWRSRFLAAFRLYCVVFASHAGIPALLAASPRARQAQGCPPVTQLWRLSGAECLVASGCGFLLPQVRGDGLSLCRSRALQARSGTARTRVRTAQLPAAPLPPNRPPAPQDLHLPVQVAGVAIAAAGLPRICAQVRR